MCAPRTGPGLCSVTEGNLLDSASLEETGVQKARQRSRATSQPNASEATLFSSPTAATTRKKKLASFYFSPGRETETHRGEW